MSSVDPVPREHPRVTLEAIQSKVVDELRARQEAKLGEIDAGLWKLQVITVDLVREYRDRLGQKGVGGQVPPIEKSAPALVIGRIARDRALLRKYTHLFGLNESNITMKDAYAGVMKLPRTVERMVGSIFYEVSTMPVAIVSSQAISEQNMGALEAFQDFLASRRTFEGLTAFDDEATFIPSAKAVAAGEKGEWDRHRKTPIRDLTDEAEKIWNEYAELGAKLHNLIQDGLDQNFYSVGFGLMLNLTEGKKAQEKLEQLDPEFQLEAMRLATFAFGQSLSTVKLDSWEHARRFAASLLNKNVGVVDHVRRIDAPGVSLSAALGPEVPGFNL